MRFLNNNTVGWAALTLGVATATVPAWVDTTPVGAGFTIGLGAMIAIYAMWSLIARDPTKDHWALSVVGLVLFLAPWVGMFAGDGAAWMAWIVGLLVMMLGGASYVQDEATNVAETARIDELARYLVQHNRFPNDPQSPKGGQGVLNASTRIIPAS